MATEATESRRRTGPRRHVPFLGINVSSAVAASELVVRAALWEVSVSVTISYNLTGRGWSECTVVIDEYHATVTASALSDAFGDLLGAVIRLVEGQPEATAQFDEEPGEYRWRFFRKHPDRLLVRILEFPQ